MTPALTLARAIRRLSRTLAAVATPRERAAIARALGTPARRQRRRPAHRPPRTEPNPAPVAEATFAPAPTPPGPITPAYRPPPVTPPPPTPRVSDEARIIALVAERRQDTPPRLLAAPSCANRPRSQCQAVDAATGRRCGLLEAHDGHHRTPRGPFVEEAAPGQTRFARDEALEVASSRRVDTQPEAGRKSAAQYQRESRARRGIGGRRLAHNGADTTTGLEGVKAYRQRRAEASP